MTTTKNKKDAITFEKQTLLAVIAIACGVVLPQIFHLAGAMFDQGTAIGVALLPMHIPIIMIGLIAGPYTGAVAGFLCPLVSYGMTGMPKIGTLPFMMIELCAYGLIAGFLSSKGIPKIAKVIITQILGRVTRAFAVAVAVYGLGIENLTIASVWTNTLSGMPGIVLQWIFIPVLLLGFENVHRNYEE